MNKPVEILKQGVEILSPFMESKDFIYRFDGSGRGSGGDFAIGKFTKGDRCLEFSFRYSLGNVFYRIGKYEIEHDTYMKFLGKKDDAKYPGFSDEPLDGFKHLCNDIENFSSDFLSGDGKQFVEFAKELLIDPDKFNKGFSEL
jgi:hypothetical protein